LPACRPKLTEFTCPSQYSTSLQQRLYFLKKNVFGGLAVACWPLVSKFAGSNPAEAVAFLGRKKILSTPSFGGEVKPSVPCRRFAARKRSLNLRGSRNLGKNYYRTSFSPTVPPFAARISRVVADGGTWRLKWECLNAGGKAMANYPQELAQDAVCQSHTGHMIGLWFLPSLAFKPEY